MYEKITLAPAGSTGNNPHTGVPIEAYDALAIEFIVEVIGATPTVTWKVQGALLVPGDSDATTGAWYDLGYITPASDSISQATQVATVVGRQIIWLSNPFARKFRRLRAVTTLNTNVTYRVEATRIR